MLLDVMNEPPEAGLEAVPELPVMLIAQVPEALPPVRVGTSKLALAPPEPEAPVPPSATAHSVIPVTEPPVIATELAFCVDIVPKEPVAAVTSPRTKAVVARCVEFVPAKGVGAEGTPVNAGLAVFALEAIALEIALNSLSISVPLTILPELPLGNVSFVAKFVIFA